MSSKPVPPATPAEPSNSWARIVKPLERSDVDRRYQLWVSPPPGYDPSRSYPLIFCLDAPWTFGTATDVARLLGLGKQIPRAIVVGVAHDTDGRDVLEQRVIDFSITPATPHPVTGVKTPAEQLGGAEAFRVWLAEVVLPQLRSEYSVSTVTFVGHSLSALFGAHVLLTACEMFDGYLLASTSVWWDDKVLLEREAQFAATGAGLPVKVYMSMGAQETDELSAQPEFHRQLAGRNYDGLELEWDCFEKENHSSVVNAAISRGLRFLLADPNLQPPSL